MKVIIDNMAYDTDKCEMVAMRRANAGEYEYLLRTQKGVLLLATSRCATCLGRPAACDDWVMTESGDGRKVVSCAAKDYCEVGIFGKIPRASIHHCHVPYVAVRIFKAGEPCDGFIIEDDSVKDRLLQLQLIKEG